MRRPPVVIGLAVGTVALILATLLLLVFNVSPGVNTNQKEIRAQRIRLAVTIETTHRVICAQAQSAANSFRFRSLTPSGKIESPQHFLTRMQAQRQTLLLSLEANCQSSPGFPPFKIQVRRALEEIRQIFRHFGRSMQVSNPSELHDNGLNLGPFEGQIGDEGVPAGRGSLKPIHPLAPPAVGGNGSRRHPAPPVEAEPPPAQEIAPVTPPVPVSPPPASPRSPKGQTVAEVAITIGEEPKACIAVTELPPCE